MNEKDRAALRERARKEADDASRLLRAFPGMREVSDYASIPCAKRKAFFDRQMKKWVDRRDQAKDNLARLHEKGRVVAILATSARDGDPQTIADFKAIDEATLDVRSAVATYNRGIKITRAAREHGLRVCRRKRP